MLMVKSSVPSGLVGAFGKIERKVPKSVVPTPMFTGAQLPMFEPAVPHLQASETEAPAGLM